MRNCANSTNVFGLNCEAARPLPDVLFSKLSAYFEIYGEKGLSAWNEYTPNQLEIIINILINILRTKPYLLIFDEFENWLDVNLQLKHKGLQQILTSILSSVHQSKIILISDQRPRLDPKTFKLPPGTKTEHTLLGLDRTNAIRASPRMWT